MTVRSDWQTNAAMQIKPIQFRPQKKIAAGVEKIAARLRTSKAAVVELAVETMLDAIESGAAVVENGRVVMRDASKLKAA